MGRQAIGLRSVKVNDSSDASFTAPFASNGAWFVWVKFGKTDAPAEQWGQRAGFYGSDCSVCWVSRLVTWKVFYLSAMLAPWHVYPCVTCDRTDGRSNRRLPKASDALPVAYMLHCSRYHLLLDTYEALLQVAAKQCFWMNQCSRFLSHRSRTILDQTNRQLNTCFKRQFGQETCPKNVKFGNTWKFLFFGKWDDL